MIRRAGVVTALVCVSLWSPAAAQQATLTPNENLVADGLPPIPASLMDEVRRYSEARTAILVDWHPIRREVLISTRFGDASHRWQVAERQPRVESCRRPHRVYLDAT